MEKNIPLIKLTIDPDDDCTGVELVSLVDRPAMKRQWMAFRDQFMPQPKSGEDQADYLGRCIPALIREGRERDQAIAICYSNWDRKTQGMAAMFAVESEEKRIVTGPMMVADLPIYRNDEMGEYYVTFDADTIRKIVYKFAKHGNGQQANVMHKQIVDGVYMFESWIIDETKGVPKGFEALPIGSWFGSFRVENDEVWAKIKDGTFNGFSVEGIFKKDMDAAREKQMIEELLKALTDAGFDVI